MQKALLVAMLLGLLVAAGARIVRGSDGTDDAGDAPKRQLFWSFQPVNRPPPPAVKNAAWARNPIDWFILAKLEEKGFSPAPEADRATLIRRATFDLTGLPPTPEEVRAFLADDAPEAYEKLVDRLLASPHYGERWGRHWLDVARYVQGRITFPGVKRSAGDQHYRDYVVRAFNTDKPYDRFVTEQLAGDLLPAPAARQAYLDQIIAPAFLSIGAWFDMETDPNRLRLEMVDEMINTTSKAFTGLSVACARCHDHPFDPIPTADYYSLGGIFRSTRLVADFSDHWRDGRVRQLRPLAMPDEVAANDVIRKQVAEWQAQRWDELSEAHARAMKAWRTDEPRYRAAAGAITAAATAAGGAAPFAKVFEAEEFSGQTGLRIAQLMRDGKAVEVIETLLPKAQWVKYQPEVTQTGQYRLEALYSTEDRTAIMLTVNGAVINKDALGIPTGGIDLKFQRWAAVGEFELREGMNFIRLDAKEGNFPRIDKFRLIKIDAAVEKRIADFAAKEKLHPLLLANFVYAPADPWPTVAGLEPYLGVNERAYAAAMTADCERLAATIAPYDVAIAVTDQPAPADLPVHPRGSTSREGEGVPRGMPRLLDQVLPRPAIPADHSGRLELAHWLTDPRNPLTSRVMVNRIWHWHFGRGIVATTSDFGSRGSPPTHPELLDWLAAEFGGIGVPPMSSPPGSTSVPRVPSQSDARDVDGKDQRRDADATWSIKHLHRLILTSSTYRMSSRATSNPADPGNALLSHFPRQRLDAEELFDSMFSTRNIMPRQVSGELLDPEKSKGRALYVLTSGRSPEGLGQEVRKMLSLFDYDAGGLPIAERPVSQTAAQSLFWLNSPLVKYYADKFAERLLKMERLDDAKRIDMAYLIAVGHPPSKEVREQSLAYLERCEDEEGLTKQQAWAKLCQAMFGSNEFRYLD